MTKKDKLPKGSLFSSFETSKHQKALDKWLLKRETISDFFEARKAGKASFSKLQANCQWCKKFQDVGVRTCLNCARDLIDDEVTLNEM